MRKFILAAALALVAHVAPAATLPWSKLVVFGDSLSDSGNFGQTATNGLTWAGELGAGPILGGGTNFAYLGARAVTNCCFGPGNDLIPDFSWQRAFFDVADPELGDDPLAVVWFGGNDLRGDPGDGSTIGPALAAIGTGIGALASTGLTRFILPNLPDLSLIPENSGKSDAVRAAISFATSVFNGGIAQLAEGLRQQGFDAKVFDTAALFATILGEPGAYGFSADIDLTKMTCGARDTCDGFLFWDDIHPTNAAHRLIAAGITELAQPAPVPLPATIWLLAGGLGGVVAVGRRRRLAA